MCREKCKRAIKPAALRLRFWQILEFHKQLQNSSGTRVKLRIIFCVFLSKEGEREREIISYGSLDFVNASAHAMLRLWDRYCSELMKINHRFSKRIGDVTFETFVEC